ADSEGDGFVTLREEERLRLLERSREGACVSVARVFPSDSLTPVTLFRRMRAAGDESFLLESVEGGESVARYTFLGTGPSARWTVRDGSARIERGDAVEPCNGPPLSNLIRLVSNGPFVPDPELPPLSRGAVGYLAYDAVRLFEEIPDRHAREGAIPDGLFLLFDAVAAFDHPRQRLLLLTTLDPTGGEGADTAADAALERLDRLERFLHAPPPVRPTVSGSVCRFDPVMPRERFLAAVESAREAIAAGEVYQAVVSQRWTARMDLDP